jgi:dTDP-4-amino-4,6-dideoxygalactose transaminase
VGAGDRVAASTFTFAATTNAIIYTGAEPVLIDSSGDTWNMAPELLEAALQQGHRCGRPIKVVIAVDLYGQCCDYDPISELCDRYGAILISDAAESLGAAHTNRPAGSFGHASVFSFNGNKIITTSGGGMVVTDDRLLAQRVSFLATQAREATPHYEHREVGFNYRLSNLLAAFGRGQLSTLHERIERRRQLNERYKSSLASLPLSFMPVPTWSEPNYWLTCILLEVDAGIDRESVRLALEHRNIESRPLWKPMHRQPAFEGVESVTDGTSDDLFARGLCLPSGSSLSYPEQSRVIEAITVSFGASR